MLNKRGPSNGLIIVFDLQYMGMRHLMRPSIEGLRAYFRFLQEALPIRLERMVMMNAASYFDMVLTLIKPFMKSEILNKVGLISSHNLAKSMEKSEKFYRFSRFFNLTDCRVSWIEF